MRFSASFLRGIYFICSVALCASQLVYFAAAILLHFQYVSFVVVAAVVVVACCTQSFNPNVLFATTLSYAHSSNHNRSNKQQATATATSAETTTFRSPLRCLPGLAWPAQFHARVNYLSTILSATKVRVPVSEPSKQAPKRTQLPPFSPCLLQFPIGSQRPAKRKRARCHDTQDLRGKGRRWRGRGVFWALLNCRSNDCN